MTGTPETPILLNQPGYLGTEEVGEMERSKQIKGALFLEDSLSETFLLGQERGSWEERSRQNSRDTFRKAWQGGGGERKRQTLGGSASLRVGAGPLDFFFFFFFSLFVLFFRAAPWHMEVLRLGV